MKYLYMPMGMWLIFKASFRRALISELDCDETEAERITAAAYGTYRQIIERLPEFEKGDRFKMNIVSCAMFAAFCKNLKELPSTNKLSYFYQAGMMNKAMRVFCKLAGRKKFTQKDYKAMKYAADLKAADRNPYSWNLDFLPYDHDQGYEARFTHCGICHLLKEEGLKEAIPAMCHLDYAMSEAGGTSIFVRKHTLATGDQYCDNGYYRK